MIIVPAPREAGVTEPEMTQSGFSVIVAEADLVGSTTLVAVTVVIVWAENDVGAVYRPAALIVPAEADQVTPVFPVPVTNAVNCWL